MRESLPFGSEMGISVAGYPEGHSNAISSIDDPSTLTPSELARSSVFDGITYTCKDDDYRKEMSYLKEKIDAGAVYGILDGLGLSQNASAAAVEFDAALQAAKGSAWARVGDVVTTDQGEGIVLELDQATGTAKIELSTEEKTCITVEKGQYQKKL